MKIIKKINLWHLTPLALLALIGVAILIWFSRGDFSTRDIAMRFEGAVQVENGQEASVKLIIENNSSRAIEDLNLFLELPDSLILQTSLDEFSKRFKQLNAGAKQEEEFKIVASSTAEYELIRARLDYSPQDIDARFVTVATYNLTIGSLDVSLTFDLPDNTFAGQEIQALVHVLANSDISNFPVFARIVLPKGFAVKKATPTFARDTIWELGELHRGDDARLEFSGTLQQGSDLSRFMLQVGKMSKGDFLPLKVAERIIGASSAAVTLQQSVTSPLRNFILPGEAVNVRLTYVNNADTPIENAIIRAIVPTQYISPSSINSSASSDNNGTITWDKTNTSQLRFINPGDEGQLYFSFNVRADLSPQNINDTNQFIVLRTSFDGGKAFEADSELSLRLGTQLNFSNSVVRNGSSLDNSGPIPPQVGQLSTYAVKWSLANSFNRVRNVRIEAVLPEYGSWQGVFIPSNENLRYESSSHTVVWEPGTLDVGLGTLVGSRSVEFKIGITPKPEHHGEIINILEATKFTGVDVFTDQFIEYDSKEVRTILPDDPAVGVDGGVVQ